MRFYIGFIFGLALIEFSGSAFGVTPISVPLDVEDQMYTLVINRLLGPDDTSHEPISRGKVYLAGVYGDLPELADMREIEEMDDRPEAVRAGAKAVPALPSPPYFEHWPKDTMWPQANVQNFYKGHLIPVLNLPQYDFVWVADAEKEMKFDERTGALPDSRPVLTVSQLCFIRDNLVVISGAIYLAKGASNIYLYIFKKDQSGWYFDKKLRGPA